MFTLGSIHGPRLPPTMVASLTASLPPRCIRTLHSQDHGKGRGGLQSWTQARPQKITDMV